MDFRFWKEIQNNILAALQNALQHDGSNVQTWRLWASLHRAIALKQTNPTDEYITNAMEGFFKCTTVATDRGANMQDVLSLLSLWFMFGDRNAIGVKFGTEIGNVQVDIWLRN